MVHDYSAGAAYRGSSAFPACTPRVATFGFALRQLPRATPSRGQRAADRSRHEVRCAGARQLVEWRATKYYTHLIPCDGDDYNRQVVRSTLQPQRCAVAFCGGMRTASVSIELALRGPFRQGGEVLSRRNKHLLYQEHPAASWAIQIRALLCVSLGFGAHGMRNPKYMTGDHRQRESSSLQSSVFYSADARRGLLPLPRRRALQALARKRV